MNGSSFGEILQERKKPENYTEVSKTLTDIEHPNETKWPSASFAYCIFG